MAIESEQSRNPLLNVPNITANYTDQSGDVLETLTEYADDTANAVKVIAGFNQVQLPDGFPYNDGDAVQLTQWEFDQISAAALEVVVTALDTLTVVIADAAMDIGNPPDTEEQAVANAEWVDASGPDDVAADATWASSDPAVATVDDSGLITALTAGTTDITATYGGITSAAVTVTVSDTP